MIIDCHADTLSRIVSQGEHLLDNSGHFDLRRARQAGIALQVLALYTPERESHRALSDVLFQIDYFEQEMVSCRNWAYSVRCREDLQEDSGMVGVMLHLEGADALGSNLSNLRLLYRLGVRSIGLTWNHRNLLADGVLDAASGGGLSGWGREVIGEMNRLGMIVDLAHVSPAGFKDAVKTSRQPVIVSHANARNLCDHPRNLNDEQMRSISEVGGVVGVTFVPGFVDRTEANVERLADHICYMIDIMGEEHVAFGSDFDGTDSTVIPEVSAYPLLIREMEKRGLTALQIDKLARGNFLRVLNNIL